MFSPSLLLTSLFSALVVKGQIATPLGEIGGPIEGPAEGPTVDLGYVKYQGLHNATAGINYFRGLHYAAPPLGALRWQKPQPIEASNIFDSGITYNATTPWPSCPQAQPPSIYDPLTPAYLFAYDTAGYAEDCLVLDVLVPDNPVSKQLPVMFQIHGGGYCTGHAQSYPGDQMVHVSNGTMIYVSIQYRLGMFGFLSGAEVAEDGVLNAGLLDQRAALDWVQRNVGAFGGDPSKVTIWGGSAGGGSVTAQLIAGGAYDEPPFSAAIAEYPWWQPFLTQLEQERFYTTALTLSNCTGLTCLRSKSTDDLQTINQQILNVTANTPGNAFGDYVYGPVVDGKFIKELPSSAFSSGNFYDVPLMVDHDAYEGIEFSQVHIPGFDQTAETADARNLFPSAGPAFFARLYDLYPVSDFNGSLFQRQQWFGDFIISCPTYQMATNAVDHNSNSSAVFKLTFAAGTEIHGATSPFLCSPYTGEWAGANNQTLAEIMTSYWISFALTHDPNELRCSDAPFWPSYISNGNGTAAIGEAVGFDTLAVTYTTISPAPDGDASARCDFFANHAYQVQN